MAACRYYGVTFPATIEKQRTADAVWERYLRVRHLQKAGWTCRDIGASVNLSHQRVSQIIKRLQRPVTEFRAIASASPSQMHSEWGPVQIRLFVEEYRKAMQA